MTSKDEFLKVLKELDLPHVEESLQSIREENVELTVKVKEYLFDPEKLKKLCWEELTLNNVKVHLNTEIKSLEELKDFDFIIIASYAKLNSLLPQEEQRELQFELCEKPLFKLPEEYKNKSIVIMDGPFMCFDPYGESGYHLGGNVVHAIHSRNIGKAPVIPEGYEELLNNGIIKNPPKTKVKEFINSSKEFFHNLENIEHIGSMFTFRTVLPNREHDDSRPTLVSIINEKTFSVFSGKISTCVEASRKIIELLKQKEQTYNLDLIILHNRDHELDKSFE